MSDLHGMWKTTLTGIQDLPESERVRLAEGFANERAHTDGEIFHKIRFYHGRQEADAENKWWARLTETKRKDLRQLLRDERYSRAFDLMLPWPGLWTSMKLGSLHRLLCLKCDEVSESNPPRPDHISSRRRSCFSIFDT